MESTARTTSASSASARSSRTSIRMRKIEEWAGQDRHDNSKWVLRNIPMIAFCFLMGCNQKQSPSSRVNLDKIPAWPQPIDFLAASDSQIIKEFESKLDSTNEFPVSEILNAQRAYGYVGNLENVKSIYESLRREAKTGSVVGSGDVYSAAITLGASFLSHQKWDSALYYLDVADSFRFGLANDEDVLNHQRFYRSIALEQLGRTDEILRIWKNQCIGFGEESLARSLRRKFGKEKTKLMLEEAMKHPVVTPLPLHIEGGHRIQDWITILPDGDSVFLRDFGGLSVRLDLPGKSCYLWAPSEEDSVTSLSAYLNKFRETRFCKILLDIDPDAPQ